MTATETRTALTAQLKKVRLLGKCRRCRKHYSEQCWLRDDGVRVCEDGSPREPTFCCGRVVVMDRVRGEHNPKIPCTAKCLMGKSLDCSCSCGGLNHGMAHSH
jgi:hypothetical protein